MLGLNTLSLVSSRLSSSINNVVTSLLKLRLPFKSANVDNVSITNSDFTTAQATINSSSSPYSDPYSSGTWTISGNGQAVNAHDAGARYIEIDAGLVSGRNYEITWSKAAHTNGSMGISSNSGARSGTSSSSSVGTFTCFLISNGNKLRFFTNGSGALGSFSVKEVDQTTSDASGNANKANLKTGVALSLNGNDKVDTSFPTSITIKTIAFWIKPTASNASESVFGGGGAFGVARALRLDNLELQSLNNYFPNTVYYNGRGGFGLNANQVTLLQDQWQRIVLTDSTGFTVVSDTFDIGQAFGSNNHGNFDIADVQIYDAQWTSSDVAYDIANPNKLATSNPSTSLTLSNLKAWWAMTEGAGSVAYDSSGGTAYNGTITGATYEKSQPTILQLGMVDWAKSTPASDEVILPANPNNTSQDILGNAVRSKSGGLNLGNRGYAEVIHSTDFDFGTGEFSVDGWVKFSYNYISSSYNAIYTNGNAVNGSGTFGIMSLNPNKIRVLVNNKHCDSTTLFNEGDWLHFAVTRKNGVLRLYINGEEESNSSITEISNTVTSSANPRIGWDGDSGRYYNEVIDDIKVYGDCLSPSEVKRNYNATKGQHTN